MDLIIATGRNYQIDYNRLVDPKLILDWLGKVIAYGGPSAAIAYGVFHWLGARWLEQRFQRSLEALKHEQQKELERVKHEIQSTFSRVSKIHEKEFEVLPRAWFLLHDAYGSAHQLLAGMRFGPDFRRQSAEDFDEFLAGSQWSSSQKEGLSQASDRQRYWSRTMDEIDRIDSERKQIAINNYLIENSIFMNEELRAGFRVVHDELVSALTKFGVGRQFSNHALEHEGRERITVLRPKIDDVEKAVQRRLRYEEA